MDTSPEHDDKPRRLEDNDEVVVYLSALDEQISAQGLDPSEAEILVENVLSEIKNRTASAASDRRTNLVIEKIVFQASLPQLLIIMQRFVQYIIFLSRNRYSSHIIQVGGLLTSGFPSSLPRIFIFYQAVFARMCYLLKCIGYGDIDENSIRDAVLTFVQPIMAELSWLAKDMCASHVIRSCCCLLAGMPVLSERKVELYISSINCISSQLSRSCRGKALSINTLCPYLNRWNPWLRADISTLINPSHSLCQMNSTVSQLCQIYLSSVNWTINSRMLIMSCIRGIGYSSSLTTVLAPR